MSCDTPLENFYAMRIQGINTMEDEIQRPVTFLFY